ncbi:MAG: lipoate--protein ligase family protein [Candidatus Cloacimonadota bacterium]|nr:MAG: lipoate--protein ligase family protein [Candidatus Cloacimonadota bacterium]
MDYRLVVMRGIDAFTQMAVDEAILDGVIDKSSPETIRFFDFCPPAITIGRLQKMEEINVSLCKKNRIDVVRRLTGGRAVVHSGDFTFSLIIKKNNPILGGNIYETYKAISEAFLYSLRSLNIPVKWEKVKHAKEMKKDVYLQHNPFCFSSISRYELTIHKKKVLGVSQYRRKDAILVQGSLLLKRPRSAFFDIFTIDDFFYIEESKVLSFEFFSDKLKDGMEHTYNINIERRELSTEELERKKLLKNKYESEEWNYCV